jgi:Tol biopolymer transport system component
MRVAIAVAVVLVALGSGSAAAQRDSAPKLVYATAINDPGEKQRIWSANADGSNAVALALGSNPELSPDGRWIAFTRLKSLMLIPSVGGRVRTMYAISGKRAFVYDSVWGPNSKQLVAYAWDGHDNHLVLVDVATDHQTEFARGNVDSPTISPNSARVAYVADQNLFVYNIASRRTIQLTRGGVSLDPHWGPFWIAYAKPQRRATGDIWLIRGGGGANHQLTHTHAGIWPDAWSADGKRLLADNPAIHNGRLWAVDVATGQARDLTGWVGDLFAQGLSRDGTLILAAIGCGGMPGPRGLLETLPFGGGRPTVIAGGQEGPCRGSWNS